MCYNFLQNENDCGDFSACMDRSKSCNGKNYIKISLTKKKKKKIRHIYKKVSGHFQGKSQFPGSF